MESVGNFFAIARRLRICPPSFRCDCPPVLLLRTVVALMANFRPAGTLCVLWWPIWLIFGPPALLLVAYYGPPAQLRDLVRVPAGLCMFLLYGADRCVYPTTASIR